MKAVLFDMDGTLVDSEKLWDVAMHQLYAKFDAVLTPEVRESTVGGSAESVIRIVYADLGLFPDPVEMAATADWLHDVTGDLFDTGLPWCEGARELLDALAAAQVPMALATIGHGYFAASVCGDEVVHGKPHPDPYLCGAELLGLAPGDCLAIEDSVTGAASAEAAGCPVVVVPNDVEVPGSVRRRQVESLAGLDVAHLRSIFADLQAVTPRF